MDGIRLQNIRSLADTGVLRLRPLTLLLGQNSSGKSTVLRSLPLLSQSIKTRSNAPVLWFGDSVDFGSVKEVRSTFAGDNTVKLEFDMGEVVVRSRYYSQGIANRRNMPLRLQIELDEVDSRTRLRSFSVSSMDDVLCITLDGRGGASRVSVNDVDYTRMLPSDRYRLITSEIVPQIIIRAPMEEQPGSYYDPYRRTIEPPQREIRKILTSKLHGRSSEENVNALARRIQFLPPSQFAESLAGISTPLKSWEPLAANLLEPSNKSTLENLRALAFIASLPDILHSLNLEFDSIANSISYIGPSRATGERYYRIQELAVDQIDPQGKNLAMFLDSLSPSQLRSFSGWLLQAIGYELKISRSTGHIQIELREEHSSHYYNIADMGYGFSQVLPIMAQIWGKPRSRVRGERLFAMEQPELHLHPAYQARLADIFANAIQIERETRSGIRFLVETHSEAMINRLGELVYRNQISPDDIAIYIFEKNRDDEITNIRSVAFDKDGTLSNWPIGFFTAGIIQ